MHYTASSKIHYLFYYQLVYVYLNVIKVINRHLCS